MNINFLKHLKINFQIDYLMEHFKLLEHKLLWSFQAPYTAHKIFIQGVILKFIMFSLKPTEKHWDYGLSNVFLQSFNNVQA